MKIVNVTKSRWSVDKIALAVLIGLVLASLWFRFPQCSYGLPASLYPDRVFTVEVAQHLAEEWRAGTWTADPKQYVYPTSYINLLAALYYFVGHDVHHEAVGRFVTMLFADATIATAFFISMELAGTAAALISAVFLSMGFLFVKEGRYPTTDSVQMFFISAALLFLFKTRARSSVFLLLSGFLAGLAVGTKYTAVLYLGPVLLVLLLWSDKIWTVRERFAAGIRWSGMVVVGFLVSTPDILFHFRYFARDFFLNQYIQDAGFIKAGSTNFLTLLFSLQTVAPETPFANSLRGGLGLPFVIAGLASLIFIVVNVRRKNDPRPFALTVSIAATYAYFYLAIGNHALRYLLPLAFMMCITASIFLVHSADWIARQFQQQHHSFFFVLVMAFLLTPIFYPNYTKVKIYRDALQGEDTRLQAVNWMLQKIPRGTRLLNLMYGPTLPSGFFDVVVWRFPEVLYQLTVPGVRGPRFSDLREQKIEWVIWNNYYTDRFFTAGGTPLEQAYANEWKDFLGALKENSEPEDDVVFEGTISPTIRMFHLKPFNRALSADVSRPTTAPSPD